MELLLFIGIKIHPVAFFKKFIILIEKLMKTNSQVKTSNFY